MGRIFGTNYETGGIGNPQNTATTAVKQVHAQQPKSPLGGLWNDVSGAVGNVINSGWNSFKSGWSWFTDHESRPSRAIETTLDKMVGGEKGTQTSWTDIFKGLTFQKSLDISGQDLVNDTVKKAAQVMNQPVPDQTDWKYKVPAFIGGLALDVVTDPFMYVGLGEAKGAVALAEDGTKLGVFTKEGVAAIKAASGVEDLSKVSEEGLRMAKARVVNDYLNGAKNLISEPSKIRIAGKTVLSTEDWQKITGRLQANKAIQYLADSKPVQLVKQFGDIMFNPRWDNKAGAEIPQDVLDAEWKMHANVTMGKKSVLKEAADFVGRDTSIEDQRMFNKIANVGLPTADGKLLSSTALKGKSLEELKSLASPEISDKALELYHSYINKLRPAREATKIAMGLSEDRLTADYMSRNYPELQKWSEKTGTISKPLKMLKAAYEKGRITDEAFIRGFYNDAYPNVTKEALDEMINNMTPSEMKLQAHEAMVMSGLSEDPVYNIAKEGMDMKIKAERDAFIKGVVEKYGTKIKPDEVKQFEALARDGKGGLYYPQGNLRFYPLEQGGAGVAKATPVYFENGAISNRLNAFSTDVQQNQFVRFWRKAQSAIVSLYFTNPATVLYHGVHNVAYNTFMADGIDAAGNLMKSNKMIQEGGAMFDRFAASGALRSEQMTGDLLSGVDKEMNRTAPVSFLKDWKEGLNPIGRNHYMNRIFNGSDAVLRGNLWLNAKDLAYSDKEAADYVNHWAGNYKDMSGVEKNGFQMLYPYYSWFKTNVKANFGAWLSNPARELIPVKTWNALNEALAGHPMWQNGPGSDFKIATGQKDKKTGRMIFVNPAYAGNIVPEIVSDPVGTMYNRIASGPIENVISTLITGKDTYEAYHNINPPESLPGAPPSAKLWKVLTELMPFDNAKNLMSNGDFLKATLSWDTSHPLWRNIMDAIIQANTNVPLPPQQLKSLQRYDYLKYLKAVRKRAIKNQ